METNGNSQPSLVHAYEAGFLIVMAVLAFLSRDNPYVSYPEIAYLFLLILGLNLSAGVVLRRWPAKKPVLALLVMANLAAITAIVVHSGGKDSNLWVLYLLPVYSVCLLLEAREILWVVLGVSTLNTLPVALEGQWNGADMFGLALKNGILIFAAIATNRIVQGDRAARRSLEAKRSDVRSLEKTLGGLGHELEQSEKLAKAGLMASGIAHDLNNVLGVVLGYVGFLRGHGHLDSEAQHDLNSLEKSVNLGRNILANYRRSVLYRDVPFSKCSLNDIIVSVLAMSDKGLRRNAIEVRLSLDKELPGIMGDCVSLERIFLNLISNAAKAMPKGGVLTLTTEAVGARGKISDIRIAVEDTGPGIPVEIIPKLFKAFSTSRQTQGGTGLGLYLSASIAQQHGGMLCAENKDEGGARFTFYIPIQEEKHPSSIGQAARNGLAIAGSR